VRLNHSPKTMTSVILTVFILALGMRPRELARLQSASSSAACPSAKKYKPEVLIRLQWSERFSVLATATGDQLKILF
jgi:hypothetical protein